MPTDPAVVHPWLPQRLAQWVVANQAVLDAVTDAFLQTGEWPDPVALERELRGKGCRLRVVSTVTEMPRELGWRSWSPQRVELTLLGVACSPAARPLMDAYARTLRLALARYDDPSRPNRLTRADVESQLGLQRADVDRLSVLLMAPGNPFLADGASDSAAWDRRIDPRVVDFEDVREAEGFVATLARQRLSPAPPPGSSEPSVFTRWHAHLSRYGAVGWATIIGSAATVVTLLLVLLPASDDSGSARSRDSAAKTEIATRIVGFGVRNDTKATRVASEAPVDIGDRLTYRIDVRNESDKPAHAVAVSIELVGSIPLFARAEVSTAEGSSEHPAVVDYDPGRYVGDLVIDPDSFQVGDLVSGRWRPYTTRRRDGGYSTSPIDLGDLPPRAGRAIIFSAEASRRTDGGQVAGGEILEAHRDTGSRASGEQVVTADVGEEIVFGLLLDNPTPALPVYDVRVRVVVKPGAGGTFARVRAMVDSSQRAPGSRRVSDPVTVNFGGQRRLGLDYVEGSTELLDASPAWGGTGTVLRQLDDGIAQGGILAVDQLGSGRLRSKHHGTEDARMVRFRMRTVAD